MSASHFSLKQKRERPAGSPPPVGFASFYRTITELNIRHFKCPVNTPKHSLSYQLKIILCCFFFLILFNIYVLMKKPSEAATALEKALSIRSQHNKLGPMESHDLLQQLINLTNMLILARDYDMVAQVLTLYENTVLDHEGSQTFDYGICQFMNGVLALSERIPAKAETYLLSAETIITDVMGTDNKYTKSVYKYLYNLYA